MRGGLVALLPLLALAGGCAYTLVEPVAADDRTTRGYRFYDPAPYLLEGCSELTLVYLPDLSRPYVVQPRAWLARNAYDLRFASGQLVQSKGEIDATALVTFLQTAAAEAIKEAASLAALSATDSAGPESRRRATLYRVVADAQGNYTGIEPVGQLGPCPGE